MKNIVNLTPHTINLNNGTSYQASGTIARVSAGYTDFDSDLICDQSYGTITGLPDHASDTLYIVSALVLSAAKLQLPNRIDLIAPATGHPDCIRNDKGQIISVPGFVR